MTNPRGLSEHDIERQLRWGHTVHAPPLIVSGSSGAASLLDAIDLHGAAREAASRVGSAPTSVRDAAAKLYTDHIRNHSPATELAVSSQVLVPTGIGLSLHDGSVTLEGQITWNYRRDAARAIQYLSNTVGLRVLEPQCSAPYAQVSVEEALKWLPIGVSKE